MILVGVITAVVAPLAYLDIAYGVHGGDKPLTDYMFTVSKQKVVLVLFSIEEIAD